MNKLQPDYVAGVESYVIGVLARANSPMTFRQLQFDSEYDDTTMRTVLKSLCEKRKIAVTDGEKPAKGNPPLVYSLMRSKVK